MTNKIQDFFIKLFGGYTDLEVEKIISDYQNQISNCKNAINKFEGLTRAKDEIINNLNKEIERLNVENQGYDELVRKTSSNSSNVEPIRRRRPRKRRPKKISELE